MTRGRMIALGIGIAVAIAVGVTIAIFAGGPGEEIQIKQTETGRQINVTVQDKLIVSEPKPPP